MSEIFEIGVSLALNDGVSQGIERARRDMAQLGRALSLDGLSMEGLRRAGRHAASPGLAAASPEPTARKPGQPTAREPLPAVTAAAAPAAHAAWQIMSSPVSTAPVENITHASLPTGSNAPSATFSGLRAEQSDTGLVGPMPPPVPRCDLLERSVADTLPVVQDVGEDAHSASPEAIYHQPGLMISPWSSSMQIPPPVWEQLAARGASASIPYYVWAEDQSAQGEAPADRWIPPHDQLTAMTAPRAAAVGMSDTSSTRMAEDARAAMPAAMGMAGGGAPTSAQASLSTPAAPAGRTSPSSAPGGDVFLDGMLVGRWMTRFLTKEAGRASAGPTKFDSRRGIILPGVTVGN